LTRYRFANVLIWLGVLMWIPFIVLRVMGEQPSMGLYLPLHLSGMMGGSRLRAFARKEMGIAEHPKCRLRKLGQFVAQLETIVQLFDQAKA
jgi:hypothetical protein